MTTQKKGRTLQEMMEANAKAMTAVAEFKFKKQLVRDAINNRTFSSTVLVKIRDILTKNSGMSHEEYNTLLLARMKEDAEDRDAQLYAEDKCRVKGHHFVIANGYQSLYDNGADVPCQCTRCGLVEM